MPSSNPPHSPHDLEILYEDNHLLAVNKPTGLPTMGVAEDRASLLSVAKEYLKEAYAKPGNVYLGIVSRLDTRVSGVVIMARTSKAAARLSEQFRARSTRKVYWALVEGAVEPPAGELSHYIARDKRHRKVFITSAATPGAQQAELRYETIERLAAATWLQIELVTGRKHQIRVQLAKIGHPILGDRKYGSGREFGEAIAIHSRRLVLEHPVRRAPLEIVAEVPAEWTPFIGKAR